MASPTVVQGKNSIQPAKDQRILVHPVSWGTYEQLLTDLIDQSSTRLCYDQGTLEIMSPSPEHERFNRTLALLIDITAEELGIDIDNLGSTTFKRENLARGFEADSCFYIQNESRIQGKPTIDLAIDPPPDLVIEIDITRASLDKFSIYAAMGVPEIWRYDGGRLQFYALTTDGYVEAETSIAFPLLTRSLVAQTLNDSKTFKRTVLIRMFREQIRALRGLDV